MATENAWQLPLPEPQKPKEDLADKVLQTVVHQVDARYASHGIEALPTQIVRRDPKKGTLVVYALYLSAVWQNNISYRLFEMTSKQPDGGLPVEVQAFAEPPVPYGIVETEEKLQQVIAKIFDDTRTRWFINTYYESGQRPDSKSA